MTRFVFFLRPPHQSRLFSLYLCSLLLNTALFPSPTTLVHSQSFPRQRAVTFPDFQSIWRGNPWGMYVMSLPTHWHGNPWPLARLRKLSHSSFPFTREVTRHPPDCACFQACPLLQCVGNWYDPVEADAALARFYLAPPINLAPRLVICERIAQVSFRLSGSMSNIAGHS